MLDIINGSFEFISGLFLWYNVYKLHQHKCVHGVSLLTFLYFTIWGYWNLYYYPALNQLCSFTSSFLVVSANTVWIIMAYKYRRSENE